MLLLPTVCVKSGYIRGLTFNKIVPLNHICCQPNLSFALGRKLGVGVSALLRNERYISRPDRIFRRVQCS